jgi:hypothetical protein
MGDDEAGIGDGKIASPLMVVMGSHNVGFDVLLGRDYLATRRVWLSSRGRGLFVGRR